MKYDLENNYFQIFLLQSTSPTGSQLSSLDVYLFISLIFVFSTLLELAIVLLVKQTHPLLMKKLTGTRSISNCGMQSPKVSISTRNIASVQTNDQEIDSWTPTVDITSNNEEIRNNINETRRLTLGHNIFRDISLYKKLDIMAFLVFNLSYIIFNVIYFSKL